jgi:formylglycine-generating enzyme required for sulfatase activity
MVLVKGGAFIMGTNTNPSDEEPVHHVTLDNFFIGKYEITQKEWREIIGSTPNSQMNYSDDNCGAGNMTWYEAIQYCNKRSEKEGLELCYSGEGDNIVCNFAANGYRLPTEAEWEYACRGGIKSKNYTYSGSNDAYEAGWCELNSGGKIHPVGQKIPNELGIYDMSGNEWEWCWDWFDKDYYQNSPAKNPPGSEKGTARIYRGGGCCGVQQNMRCTLREYLIPSYKHFDMGFRVVRKVKNPKKIPTGMVLVSGGTFPMGSTDSSQGIRPAHKVVLNSFYMGKYEVTQDEWNNIMGYNTSFFSEARNPIDGVRWYEAIEYCNKKSKMEGLTPCYSGSGDNITCNFAANGYRLPTEAEWEYACRGGQHSGNYTYSGSNDPEEVAWYVKNLRDRKTRHVGLKKPNELGIYDMTGNAWEWCWDWYDHLYYKKSPIENPTGPTSGVRRVVRGGNVYNQCLPSILRVGFRPINGFQGYGFRVVRTAM